MRFVIRVLGNMLGIWLATVFISSITLRQGESLSTTLLYLAVVAVLFAIINSLVRPLVKVIAFPLYLVTFGLFALVTNALIFSLTGWLSTIFSLPLTVGSFWAAVGGGTITAIVSAIVVAVLGPVTGTDSSRR